MQFESCLTKHTIGFVGTLVICIYYLHTIKSAEFATWCLIMNMEAGYVANIGGPQKENESFTVTITEPNSRTPHSNSDIILSEICFQDSASGKFLPVPVSSWLASPKQWYFSDPNIQNPE